MKRYKNAFMEIERHKGDDDKLSTVVFTVWIFCLLLFFWFLMWLLFRVAGWFWITRDDIQPKCSYSQEHQETITALADIRQSIEVFNDLTKK